MSSLPGLLLQHRLAEKLSSMADSRVSMSTTGESDTHRLLYTSLIRAYTAQFSSYTSTLSLSALRSDYSGEEKSLGHPFYFSSTVT